MAFINRGFKKKLLRKEKLETPNGNRSWKMVLANYTTSKFVLNSGKVLTKVVGNMMFNWVGTVLDTLDFPTDIWCQEMISNQHAKIWHLDTIDWESNIASRKAPIEGQQNKYDIQGNIKILMGRDCEVEN